MWIRLQGPPLSNEAVGKVLLTSENDVFRGHLTLPKHEIVDCGAFYEVTFFYISPKNLLGDFFYSLNAKAQREPDLSAIRWSHMLDSGILGFITMPLPYQSQMPSMS